MDELNATNFSRTQIPFLKHQDCHVFYIYSVVLYSPVLESFQLKKL